MESHVNGWPIVSKYLGIKGKRQADLARQLQITPSAISQIKNGDIFFSAKQIAAIIKYLEIEIEDICEFYTQIFNARLINNHRPLPLKTKDLIVKINNTDGLKFSSNIHSQKDESIFEGKMRKTETINFSQMATYESALESPANFAHRSNPFDSYFYNNLDECFGVRIETGEFLPEFPRHSVLLVAGGEFPANGNIVIAKLHSGDLFIGEYLNENGIVRLSAQKANTPSIIWNHKENPGYVQWIYPVLEASLKLRQ